MAVRVNQEQFDEKVLKADKPVLLDFYSDTCIPCKRMSGLLLDLEEEYEDQIYIYKVNVNYDEELAKKYEVMSVPTLVVIENGEEKNRLTGAVPKDEVVKLLGDSVQ